MKILIATPVYNDAVTTTYMMSVQRLLAALQPRGAVVSQFFLASSLIPKARNAYVSLFLEDPSYTHLLFIDSDMGFAPSAVTRMLDFDKEITACIYPARRMDFERVHKVSRAVEEPRLAERIAHNYVATHQLVKTGDGYVVERGFVRTRRIGMGLTLIKRSALEKMAEAFPELCCPPDQGYATMGIKNRVFQCFEQLQVAGGLYVSEDFSFSIRWVDLCGGEMWACIDETMTHVGRHVFEGRFIDQLRNPVG